MRKDYKVFIGNIPYDCRESDIHKFFRGYGRIKEVVLKNNYGFCEFLEYGDARDAVRELNGERLLGVRVTVEMARGDRQDQMSREQSSAEDKFCVYMGQLPPDTTETDVDRFFNGYGRLTLIMLRSDHCFAFIEGREDAEEAVHELKGRKIRGQNIKLELIDKENNNEFMKASVSFPRYILRVRNLSQNTASQELKDYMKQAGHILDCQAQKVSNSLAPKILLSDWSVQIKTNL